MTSSCISLQTQRPVSKMKVVLAVAFAVFAVPSLAPAPALARGTPETFADLSEKLLPAVVNISTTQTLPAERSPEMPQFPPGSPFEEFFKDFLDRQQRGAPNAAPRKATSLGSGFVIDPDGYIVTNNHVIQDADEITVIFADDTALKAEIVGRDPKVDVALLKVKPSAKLPSVDFGDSDKARVGDWVLAIGNPFGLGGTVTAGIISAKTRDINAGPYDNFIQTDASINRGNSGGPLFNINGEVVGINTAIYSPSGGSVGIGFATPSNIAKQVINDLRKFGHTRRGWLGVRIQTVTDEIADSLGLKKARGALVASSEEGSPAMVAGIKPGDVVLEWNGQEVKEMRKLPIMVAETEIGATVPVVVWRDGERVTLKVTVGELKDEQDSKVAKSDPDDKKKPAAPKGELAIASLGLSVTAINEESRQRFTIPPEAKGVVVSDVKGEGPAVEKGLQPGDILVEVNQKAVANPEDVEKQVAAAKAGGRKSVLLLVQNGSGMRFVAVNLPE